LLELANYHITSGLVCFTTTLVVHLDQAVGALLCTVKPLITMDGLSGSVFVQDDAPVYEMPVSAINRPLPSTLDNSKVQQFVKDMQVGCSQTYQHQLQLVVVGSWYAAEAI
jgi:hypothetical protein